MEDPGLRGCLFDKFTWPSNFEKQHCLTGEIQMKFSFYFPLINY
jgi:hypothetical protein